MPKILSLACGVASLFSLAPCLLADSPDSTYFESGQVTPVRRFHTYPAVRYYGRDYLPYQPIAYYPTLRYYGKDYTVHYGFVPVTRQTIRRIYETDPLLLSPDDATGDTDSARVVVGSRRLPAAPTFRTTKVKVTTETTVAPREIISPVPIPPLPPAAATLPATPATPASSGPLQPALPAPAETVIQPPAEAK